MDFEIQDRRDDTIQFNDLKFLECFYIGDPKEPYIRVPDFLYSMSGLNPDILLPDIEVGTPAIEGGRTFNALRIRTLQYIYIVPSNMVHKLQSKLVLTTKPLEVEKEQDAGKNNTSA